MQDLVIAPLPPPTSSHVPEEERVLGVSARTTTHFPLSQSSFRLRELQGNQGVLERAVQKSLYSDDSPGSAPLELSSSKRHQGERKFWHRETLRVPWADCALVIVSQQHMES